MSLPIIDLSNFNEISLDEIKTALANGYDINATDIIGNTTLINVCRMNDWYETNKIYMTNKTLLLQPDVRHFAISDHVKLLVDNNAYLNAKTINGDTALIYACGSAKNLDAIEYLIEHRADVNASNHDGLTPLQQARQRRLPDHIIEKLIKHGANVN